MKKDISLKKPVGPTRVLTPPSSLLSSRPASSLSSQADSMAGKSVELGGGVWDPLGLADLGSERTLRWFRAAEVKHCRVAMLATLGWAHTCNGWSKIVYPGGENLGTDPWKVRGCFPF